MRDALLNRCASLATRRPGTVVAVAVIAAALSIALAASRLRLNANTDDLISPDRPYMQDYRAFLDEFGDLEYIYVVVDAKGDDAQARACVDELTERLRGIDGLPRVVGAIEPEEQLAIATRAMTDDELAGFALSAEAFPEILSGGGPAALVEDARRRMARLNLLGVTLNEQKRRDVGAAAMFELKLLASALPESAAATEMDGLAALPAREYLVSDTGRLYFIEIKPVKDYGTLAVIEEPLRKIRAVLDDVRKDFPGVDTGLTGKPVLQADEMRTTDADMTRSSVIAVILVALLFMVVAGGVVRPALAVGSLLLAIAWTFGLTTLVVGQLNLLSVVFTLILVGIGIDFGAHVITRYMEARGEGADPADAVRRALMTSGRGNVTGALTSSIAFFMALLTDFRGLQELGFIAGTGLLLCLLSMCIVLPALLVLVDGRRNGTVAAKAQRTWPNPTAKRPLVWLAVLAAVTLAFAPGSAGVSFEGNLLELQADGLDSVVWEHRIFEDSSSATWFGAAVAEDSAAAEALVQRAAKEPLIGAVHSALDIVRPDSEGRDTLRASLHPEKPVEIATWQELRPDKLRRAHRAFTTLLGRAAGRVPDEEMAELRRIDADLERLQAALDGPDADGVRAAVSARVRGAAAALRAMLDGDRLSLREALPLGLRERYVAPGGRFLVAMHPTENVWDVAAMNRFVEAMRRVDPDVTGVPITQSCSIEDMRNGFARAALLALGAVVLLVLIDFRRIGPAALAITPLIAGAVWLIEAMGFLDIHFNLANFFSVPILIGIGVDNGVHLVHRFLEGGDDRHRLGSTHRGVFLTSATSIIGFGCLAIATHRGLRSLGHVMALGAGACLLASFFVLPPILAWADRRRTAR